MDFRHVIPWTRQPQVPVGPASPDIIALWHCGLAPNNLAVDVARNVNVSGNTNTTSNITAWGLGSKISVSTLNSAAFKTTSINALAVSYTQRTYFWVGYWDASGLDGPHGLFQLGSSTAGFGLVYRTGVQDWAYKLNSTEIQTAINDTTPGMKIFFCTYNQPNMELWLNGIRYATSSTGPTSVVAPATLVINGGDPDALIASCSGLHSTTLACGIINRALTEAEIVRYSTQAGIWSLFKPIQRRIWASNAGGGNTGTIAVTLENFTSSISGTTTIVGTINQTTANFTSSITGTPTITGTLASTMDAFTSSISGTAGEITGTIAQTLEAFVSAFSGTTTIIGNMAASLEDVTSSITGTTTIVGTIAQTMADFTSSMSGFIGTQTARLLALMGVGS